MLRLTIVVLLNGGIFMTKYKRRNKSGLTTRKNYKTGKRAEQAGCGLRMGKGKVTRALKSSFNLIICQRLYIFASNGHRAISNTGLPILAGQ